MAVSELELSETNISKLYNNTPSLFGRLPEQIFSPLASANKHHYWALLCNIYEKRFSSDAPLPPSNGFLVQDILQDITSVLEIQELWKEDYKDEIESNINARANAVYKRLIDSGWFFIEKQGVVKRVSMRPVVSQFLANLVSFAETGPVFVSGKIRSIGLNIQLIVDEEATGDTLIESADQVRNLLEHVRNTGTNIRDVMDEIRIQNISTSDYVRRFFNDYIENVFIADYRELRTRDHPLSNRHNIIKLVENISESDAHRERLILWYKEKRCGGNHDKAEILFYKDIERIHELRRIDEYLERLDDEVRRANRAALAYLDFRIRSLQPLDKLVQQAIDNIKSDDYASLFDPFPSGELLNETGLAIPRIIQKRESAKPLRTERPSIRHLAQRKVAKRFKEKITVTSIKLAEFLKIQLQGKSELHSDNLPLMTIENIRSYQVLSRSALEFSIKNLRSKAKAMTTTRGYKINLLHEPENNNEIITGRPFYVVNKLEPTTKNGKSK